MRHAWFHHHLAHAVIAASVSFGWFHTAPRVVTADAPTVVLHPGSSTYTPFGGLTVPCGLCAGETDIVTVVLPDGHCMDTDPLRTEGYPLLGSPGHLTCSRAAYGVGR